MKNYFFLPFIIIGCICLQCNNSEKANTKTIADKSETDESYEEFQKRANDTNAYKKYLRINMNLQGYRFYSIDDRDKSKVQDTMEFSGSQLFLSCHQWTNGATAAIYLLEQKGDTLEIGTTSKTNWLVANVHCKRLSLWINDVKKEPRFIVLDRKLIQLSLQ